MTPEQIDAMNNYANGLAEAIVNEMAPSYFPGVMTEDGKAGLKLQYIIIAKAFYKFTNGLTE